LRSWIFETAVGDHAIPACTSQAFDALLPQFAAAVVDSVELGGTW
jgi:hypothetical protein